jgi:putative DNA primase/helicase
MTPVPTSWLWPGYVPGAALTVITGDPGSGKSLVSIDLAARVTTGASMPDGTPVVPNGDACLAPTPTQGS